MEIRSRPVAVPIHDIIPLVTGKFSQKGAVTNWLKGSYYKFMLNMAKNAEEIVTLSKTSKQDIVEYLHVPDEKVNVIYLAASEIFAETVEPEDIEILGKHSLQSSSYFIYDGGLEANKNASTLLNIFSQISGDFPNLKLVITGGDFAEGKPANPRAVKFLTRAEELHIQGKIVPTGRISDVELAVLLRNALAYINLSSYEGFGLGPAQAMSAGVFTIVSDSPPFPEIAADGALIINAKKPDNAAAKIVSVLRSQQELADYVRRGHLRSKNFDWETTYARTWDLILKVAHNG